MKPAESLVFVEKSPFFFLCQRLYPDCRLLCNSPRNAEAAFLPREQAERRLRAEAQLARARQPTQVGVEPLSRTEQKNSEELVHEIKKKSHNKCPLRLLNRLFIGAT